MWQYKKTKPLEQWIKPGKHLENLMSKVLTRRRQPSCIFCPTRWTPAFRVFFCQYWVGQKPPAGLWPSGIGLWTPTLQHCWNFIGQLIRERKETIVQSSVETAQVVYLNNSLTDTPFHRSYPHRFIPRCRCWFSVWNVGIWPVLAWRAGGSRVICHSVVTP